MTLSESSRWKKGVELGGTAKNGWIEKGKEWYKTKMAQGCVETEVGILTLDEVRAAGLVARNGQYLVPIEEYIAEHNTLFEKKGQKYKRVSLRFMNWLHNKQEDPVVTELKDSGFMDKSFTPTIEEIPF